MTGSHGAHDATRWRHFDLIVRLQVRQRQTWTRSGPSSQALRRVEGWVSHQRTAWEQPLDRLAIYLDEERNQQGSNL